VQVKARKVAQVGQANKAATAPPGAAAVPFRNRQQLVDLAVMGATAAMAVMAERVRAVAT
jgi:hypothetical protein